MKTLLITIIAFALSLSTYATTHYGNSQLNIRLAAYSNYTVVFNNTTYFATEWVKIFNVPAGKHYLRIEETVQSRNGRATGKRLIYQGYVTVPAQSRVFSNVGFNRDYFVSRIERTGSDYRPRANDRRDYDREYGYEYGYRGKDKGKGASQDRDDDYGYDNDDDEAYDDGTYGASQLRAQPATGKTAKDAPQQLTKSKK